MLESCIGHFIERVCLDEDHQDNALDVWLIAPVEARKPDVVISLSRLHSVRPWEPGLFPSFIDGISLVHLPELPLPWPAEAVGRLDRSGELPALVWLRITGPVEVDAVASIVTVYQAQSDDVPHSGGR